MKKFKLFLLGTVSLLDDQGDDHTPKLAKTQALLAYLALAEGRPVNRQRLQDLLWSDRSSQQGRDSLRKAISDLRKSFEGAVENPVISYGGPVSLNLDCIEVDIFNLADDGNSTLYSPDFLEGLNIYDPNFNEWLNEVRLMLERYNAVNNHNDHNNIQAQSKRREFQSLKPFFTLGILPLEEFRESSDDGLANLLIDRLSQLCLESAIIRPFDLRNSGSATFDAKSAPDCLLSVRTTTLRDKVTVSFNFQQCLTHSVVLSLTLEVEKWNVTSNWIHRNCSEIFDQLCEKLTRHCGFESNNHRVAKRVFFAIDRIFRLSKEDITLAGDVLEEACSLTDSSTVFAWNAYLTAFQLEKSGVSKLKELKERATHYGRLALEKGPYNALTVALVSHAYGFVLKDCGKAEELLEPWVSKPYVNPMLADTLAMSAYYRGNYKKSALFANWAVELGRFNPFRYSFTTSRAMTNLMLGDFRAALDDCSRSIQQHPAGSQYVYEPMLRVRAAAGGYVGNHEVGSSAYVKLTEQLGEAPLALLRNSDLTFPNSETLQVYKEGMEKINEN